MVKSQKGSSTFVASTVFGAFLATYSMAATSPDFPVAGWATQNGGVTGGAGKTVVTVDDVSGLRKYAEAGNATIYVKPGTYTVPSKSTIKVGSNVTIYGYQGAIIAQTYTDTKNEDNTAMAIVGKNVIIRNLTFKGAGAVDKDAGDCLHVKGGTNVWLDHLDVYDGEDGNLDVINGANYVTISWTRFHYTGASKEHQFSNLIGNSDDKAEDQGKLKTTLHHNWWDNGVKERMPRVRSGQVHVANNLFSSNTSNHCVRAGKKADLRVENNVFIGVKKPIDLYDGDYTAVLSKGNYTEGTSGNTGSGTNANAFTPPYSMGLTDVGTQERAYALRDSIKLYAGATLPDPGSTTPVTPESSSSQEKSSSSVAKSSSSEAKSSSSVAKSSSSIVSSSSEKSSSSSSVVSGEASLTKHGSGSANQEVKAGTPIAEFYYTVAGATGATVTGLPAGVTGVLKGSDFFISGTVDSAVPTGVYKFTVTTTGASKNVSKSGAITVEGLNLTVLALQTKPKTSLSISGRTLLISGAVSKAVSLFDMQGCLLYTARVTDNGFSLLLPGVGNYLVRIGSERHLVRVR